MAVQSETMAAISQICADRGISRDEIFEIIASSVKAAILKENGVDAEVTVGLNSDEDITIYVGKKVVKTVKDDVVEISLKDAKSYDPKPKIGGIVKVDVPMSQFGRIAAQVAKNVLMGGVRDAEKSAIFKEFKEKMGTVLSGKIQRMRGKTAIVEIDRAMTVLPVEEQIPGEFYKLNERYRVLIVGVEMVGGVEEIVVSRARPEFLAGLFELEIPEVSSGSVQIKGVAREVGARSKVAVYTDQDGIDPQGACIGQRGVRITNIMSELGNEKVDVVLWDEDVAKYIAKALSPATINSVKINAKAKTAKVEVDDDQLSLAIGRDANNVRLVARLTGYKISIVSPALKGKPLSSEDDIAEVNESTFTIKKMVEEKENAESKANAEASETPAEGEKVEPQAEEPKPPETKPKSKSKKKTK